MSKHSRARSHTQTAQAQLYAHMHKYFILFYFIYFFYKYRVFISISIRKEKIIFIFLPSRVKKRERMSDIFVILFRRTNVCVSFLFFLSPNEISESIVEIYHLYIFSHVFSCSPFFAFVRFFFGVYCFSFTTRQNSTVIRDDYIESSISLTLSLFVVVCCC